MSATVKQAYDAGDDVLLVEGYVDGVVDEQDEPLLVRAQGWVSALENHYDEDGYDEEGNRVEDATPRPMTAAERLEYCRGLLLDQHAPDQVRQPTPVDIGDS